MIKNKKMTCNDALADYIAAGGEGALMRFFGASRKAVNHWVEHPGKPQGIIRIVLICYLNSNGYVVAEYTDWSDDIQKIGMALYHAYSESGNKGVTEFIGSCTEQLPWVNRKRLTQIFCLFGNPSNWGEGRIHEIASLVTEKEAGGVEETTSPPPAPTVSIHSSEPLALKLFMSNFASLKDFAIEILSDDGLFKQLQDMNNDAGCPLHSGTDILRALLSQENRKKYFQKLNQQTERVHNGTN